MPFSRQPDAGRSTGGAGPDPDPAALARALVLQALERRPHSRAELAERLRRRRVPDDIAVVVLDRYTEVGLVDDAAFAAGWVDSRQAGRGLARRGLAYELRGRGVAEPMIDAALARVDGADEVATAQRLIERRLPSTAGLPLPARVRRLTGLLTRRGYSPDLAARIIRRALETEAAHEAGRGEPAELP